MFTTSRCLVPLVAALSLLAALAVSPTSAEADNFKPKKFHRGNFPHQHQVFFKHQQPKFHFHRNQFQRPFFVRPVIAVPAGPGVVFIVK